MSSSTGVRLTMKFNFLQQFLVAGWSESYDLGFADLPTAIAANDNIQSFMRQRCLCLGVGPLLVEAVLSAYVQPIAPGAPPVRRSSVSIPVPPKPLAGQSYNKEFNVQSELDYTADFAPTVLYFSMQTSLSGSPVYFRNYWMAALPDVADRTNSSSTVDPATDKAVKAFMLCLMNKSDNLGGKCGVSIRSIDRSGANPLKNCTAWNIVADSYNVPNHGFVINQPILAVGMTTKVKGGSAPRGRYLVAAVPDANTIYLQGSNPPSEPKKTGAFRAAVVAFNLVSVVTIQGFTKRDKGGPFGKSVGRRPSPLTKRA